MKGLKDSTRSIILGVTSAVSLGFFTSLLPLLRNKGWKVAVVSGPYNGPPTNSSSDPGAEVVTIPLQREIALASDMCALISLWQLFRRRCPDVIDFGTPKAGLLGMLAGFLAGVPTRVYTVRGLRFEGAQGWKRRLLMLSEWVACKCAHRVICVSPSVRREVIKCRLASSEKLVLLNKGTCAGICVNDYLPSVVTGRRAAALRKTLGIADGSPVVGFVGRLTYDKGITDLVQAYEMLREEFKNLTLLLVGDFESGDPIGPVVRRRIEADQLIIKTGFVSSAALYYHVMDLLVLPTYREGFPSVPLEAQLAGKPVVTTNATGAVDSVIDGETGVIVPVADPAALSQAIARLIRSSELRSTMGAKGQRWVRENFDASILTNELLGVYQRLIEQGSKRVRFETGNA